MLKIVKIMSIWYALFLFESYSMISQFDRAITGKATDKRCLFNELQSISVGEDKNLADWYLALYGEHAVIGEERKITFNSIKSTFQRKKITGAAAYVVQTLFNQARFELFDINTLNECIRVGELLLLDAPQLAAARPMDNIGDMLKEAMRMREAREEFGNKIMRFQQMKRPQTIGFAAANL